MNTPVTLFLQVGAQPVTVRGEPGSTVLVEAPALRSGLFAYPVGGDAVNEDALVTAAEAAAVFTLQRGTPVSRHMVHNWVTRYAIEARDKLGARSATRYRIGDLMDAERRARMNDSGGGRGRVLAA